MKVLHLFVDRPAVAVVAALVILLLGLAGLRALTVRQYPETTSTTITITTPYVGADADVVRGFVTTPLEQAISTAAGVSYLNSTSSQGQSRISARLSLNYDPNDALAEILSKINQVSNRLPEEAENPVIAIARGGDAAAMYLAFYSDEIDRAAITDYLSRSVRPRLEVVEGVQRAQIQGTADLAMRIWLDPRRMAAFGVTASDVRAALERNNFVAALGDAKGSTLSISLRAETNVVTPEGFRELIVREEAGATVRLGDIADVRLGAESYDASLLFEGANVVFIGIETSPKANLLETIAGVRAVAPDILSRMPDAIEGLIVYDSTIAVQSSIDEVVSSLVEALVIVSVVLFFFLGALRAALVPAVAMPLAIVGAFFLMLLVDYSINLLTLLALILAIGTVVDDGIVIVENAMRHIEDGADPDTAAKRTIDELASSIVAMNIVVLAVFAPVGLIGGLTGALFTEFAYTVAGATLISGVVGLTLSPMMCAQLLKSGMTRSRLTGWVDAGFRRTASGYGRLLGWALDARWAVLAVGAVALGANLLLFQAADKELAPQEDDGFLMVLSEGDPNGSIDQLERWTARLTERLEAFPAVEHAFAVNGAGPAGAAGSSAFGGVILKDWRDRDLTTQALQPKAQAAAAEIPGLDSVVIPPPPLPGTGGGAPIQFVVSAIDDARIVLDQAEDIRAAALQSGLFAYLQSDLKFDKLETTVEIDRDKAADIGVGVDAIGRDLSTLLSAADVNLFTYDGRSYRVIPQAARLHRLRPEQIGDYYVRAGDGSMTPLDSVVSFEENVVPRQLLRFNQLNSATLSGVPAPGVELGEAIAFLQDSAADLPGGFVADWAGPSRRFVEEGASMALTFGLAVALMYLTLAAQYNSFRDPAVMLLSVPMALVGALFFAAAGVMTINIYTQIGLLALIGSIIRHGILLVEFANDVQERDGVGRRAAMEKAAQLRLRAILMTTVATLLGLLPLLASTSGPGAESRFAISFTLGVGMLVGTAFTLFVVPALYVVVARTRSAGRSTAASG